MAEIAIVSTVYINSSKPTVSFILLQCTYNIIDMDRIDSDCDLQHGAF